MLKIQLLGLLKTILLFVVTALAEIFGCYTAWLWLRMQRSAWYLLPGMVSLALFAWLLTLHPTDAAGRTYAAYGGIYIITALGWLYFIEHRIPNRWDVAGSIFCLIGMGLIMWRPN